MFGRRKKRIESMIRRQWGCDPRDLPTAYMVEIGILSTSAAFIHLRYFGDVSFSPSTGKFFSDLDGELQPDHLYHKKGKYYFESPYISNSEGKENVKIECRKIK